MFSSINFLFLLSLGFISWTILCYIQQIEQIKPNLRKTPTVLMEETPVTISNSPTETQHLDNQPKHAGEKYNLYVNFLGIFVCIYVLAKLILLAETYMAKRIHHKIYIPRAIDYNPDLPTDSLNELHEQQDNLKWKLNSLEKQNQAMKLKLREVIQTNASSLHYMHADVEENMQNIIITNKHIHLTGKIYVNQDETQHRNNAEFKEPNIDCDNNVDIWEKYLKLQKVTAPQNLMFALTDDVSKASMPAVMSSQELKSIKGIF